MLVQVASGPSSPDSGSGSGSGSGSVMVASTASSCGPVELAHIFAITNQNLGTSGPPVTGDYRGIPVLGVVAYGEEHQREEVSHTK